MVEMRAMADSIGPTLDMTVVKTCFFISRTFRTTNIGGGFFFTVTFYNNILSYKTGGLRVVVFLIVNVLPFSTCLSRLQETERKAS